MFKKLIQKITEWWRNRKRRGVGGHEYVVADRVPVCMDCKHSEHNWLFKDVPCRDCRGLNRKRRSYFVPKKEAARS